MTAKAVETLSQGILEGSPEAELQPLVDEIFSTALDQEDIISLYKHLPRSLTNSHIEAVIEAERKQQSTEVSNLLLLTDFEGLEPLRDAKSPALFLKVVNHVVHTLGDLKSPAVQQWRLYLLNKKAVPGVDLEGHAVGAMVAALATPSQFIFEPIVDSVSNVTLKNDDSKKLLALLKDVMIEASGAQGLKKWEATGKDLLQRHSIAEIVKRKATLLSLCRILKAGSTVSFDALRDGLGLANDEEVESAVVDAVLAQIIDAGVSKDRREVVVHSVEPLKFDKDAWKALSAQLANWAKLTERCML